MKHTNPDGTQFDFDRIPKVCLVEWFIKRNTTLGGELVASGFTSLLSAASIIEAARVPQERKGDVVRELAERLVHCLGPMTHELQREYAERYRNAI